jgi:hypothetical protein
MVSHLRRLCFSWPVECVCVSDEGQSRIDNIDISCKNVDQTQLRHVSYSQLASKLLTMINLCVCVCVCV